MPVKRQRLTRPPTEPSGSPFQLAPGDAGSSCPRARAWGSWRGPGSSPGLLSAGLGSVPAEQTYLDITQGNRVFDSLYDSDLPPLGDGAVLGWAAVESAPNPPPPTSSPGFSSTLRSSGVGVRVGVGASLLFRAPCRRRQPTEARESQAKPPTLTPPQPSKFASSTLRALPSLARILRGDDLLIAIERRPPAETEALAIGIAGPRLRRRPDLRQHPHRRLRPLHRHRADGPRAPRDRGPVARCRVGRSAREGGRRPGGDRIARRDGWRRSPQRRGPVIGFALLAWLARPRAAVAAIGRGPARPARACASPAWRSSTCRCCCCSAAALEPSQGAEQLLGDASARRCWRRRRSRRCGGYRALAVAAALTVARLRDRRGRRLAAHLALAARAQPGPGRPLLRDRQRARGAARGARRRRHRRGA